MRGVFLFVSVLAFWTVRFLAWIGIFWGAVMAVMAALKFDHFGFAVFALFVVIMHRELREWKI